MVPRTPSDRNEGTEEAMTWALFLDDERFPPDDGRFWMVARNVQEAFDLMDMHGIPSFMSLDHDLGIDQPTGYDFVKMLIDDFFKSAEYDEADLLEFPYGFQFYVHSQNPVGAANIEQHLSAFIEFWNADIAESRGG
jgi:hypothetical protein